MRLGQDSREMVLRLLSFGWTAFFIDNLPGGGSILHWLEAEEAKIGFRWWFKSGAIGVVCIDDLAAATAFRLIFGPEIKDIKDAESEKVREFLSSLASGAESGPQAAGSTAVGGRRP